MPYISLIIPIYNSDKYLEKCINSIINQTFKDIEIILVNDGSKDKSGIICDTFAINDKRIKVIHKMNSGLSSARNIGIENSSGKYVVFLDSDDWMNVETLECVLELTEKYGVDLAFWSYKNEYINRTISVNLFKTSSNYMLFNEHKMHYLRRRAVGLINRELISPTKTDALNSAWGKMYKKELILENNIRFLDTSYIGSEDVLFNIQAFFYTKQALFINRHFNHYRRYSHNSLTKKHTNTLFHRFKNLYYEIEKFIVINNLDYNFKKALWNRFSLSLINNSLSIVNSNYISSPSQKIRDIDKILNDTLYKMCLSKLDFDKLTFYWKVYFTLAKNKLGCAIYFVVIIYRIIKK